MCVPQVINSSAGKNEEEANKPENQEIPFLQLRGIRHPCLEHFNETNIVPNDVIINQESSRSVLITGPNMGGKSTLLRSVCSIIIMAQIGSCVPAIECIFTACDAIFTRIGASDRILEHKSTFFVELEETKRILEQATKNSLVIIDELGRGTSTFDGYALANSCFSYLNKRVRPLCMFTTHYNWLVDDFKNDPGVVLYHMKCEDILEDEEDLKQAYIAKLYGYGRTRSLSKSPSKS